MTDYKNPSYVNLPPDSTTYIDAVTCLTESYLQLLQNTLDGLDDIASVLLPDLSVVLYNKAGYKALGVTPEEVRGRKCFEIIGLKEACTSCAVLQSIACGNSRQAEKYCPHKNKYLHIQCIPVKDKDNNIMFIVETIRDISSLKKTEQRLLKSEEKFRMIFENANDAMYVLRMEKESMLPDLIIEANPAACRMLHYSREEFTSMPLRKIVAPEEDDAAAEKSAEQMTNVHSSLFESIHVTKSGRRIPVEISSHFSFYNGEYIVLSQVRDISQRKQEELRNTYEKIQQALDGTIIAMAKILEIRDPYTAGHQQQVTKLACAIAAEMDLDKDMSDGIRVASMIHDIGKIYVPAEILAKPGNILKTEYDIIKSHVVFGYQILNLINFPWPVAEIVLQHHERMDGSGYPNGIKGSQILLQARILAVADVVEAMSAHRPYRPARGVSAALEEISANSGTLYDKNVVSACLKLFESGRFKFFP